MGVKWRSDGGQCTFSIVKLQDIRFKFVFYWVICEGKKCAYMVPFSSYILDSCKVFWQMCFKKPGRCEYTAQIPPTSRIRMSTICLRFRLCFFFNWDLTLKGPELVFSLDGNCNCLNNWQNYQDYHPVSFDFSQEFYCGGNSRHLVWLNGNSALAPLIWSRNAWSRLLMVKALQHLS